MKCSYCGHELKPGVSFCNQCGTAVDQPENPYVAGTGGNADPYAGGGNADPYAGGGSADPYAGGGSADPYAGGGSADSNAGGGNADPYAGNNNGSQSGSKEKYKYMILGGIVLLAVLAGFIVKYLKSKPVDEDPYDFTQEQVSDTELDSMDEVTEDSSINTVQVDVEEEVVKIRQKYNEIVESISDGTYKECILDEGVLAYADGYELKSLTVYKGVNNNHYTRYYYYDNYELIFAYYEDSDSHRFYFCEDQLIRWRYAKDAQNAQEAENYDLLDTEDYKEWQNFVNKEGIDYLSIWHLAAKRTQSGITKYLEGVEASSELSEYGMTHSAERVMDGDLTTAWVEDGSDIYGLGESITITFERACLIEGLKIYAGYHKSSELYEKNCRPSRICIDFGNNIIEEYNLADSQTEQIIEFEYPIVTKSVTISIFGVYYGSKYSDTAISEIEFY